MKSCYIVLGCSSWLALNFSRYLIQKEDAYVIGVTRRVNADLGLYHKIVMLNQINDNQIDGYDFNDSEFADFGSPFIIDFIGYSGDALSLEKSTSEISGYSTNYIYIERFSKILTKLNPKKYVYISSIAVYDWVSLNGNPAKEDCGAYNTDTNTYGGSKFQGELLVRNYYKSHCIIRLASVFGKGENRLFRKMANSLKNGYLLMPESSSLNKSVISIDLFVDLLHKVIHDNSSVLKTVNMAIPEPVSIMQAAKCMRDIVGTGSIITIPAFLMSAVLFFLSPLKRFSARFTYIESKIRSVLLSTVVDTSLLYSHIKHPVTKDFRSELSKYIGYYRN